MSSMVISWLYSYTRHNDIVIVGTVPIIRGDKGYNPKMTLKKNNTCSSGPTTMAENISNNHETKRGIIQEKNII